MVNNIYQFISSTILNNEIRTFGCTGKYARILKWNSATPLKISFDGSSFQDISAGMFIKLSDSADPFTLIYVQNLTGGDLLLEMGISSGEIGDNRLTVTGTVISSIPGLAVAAGYGLVAISSAAGGTLVAASNAARRSIIIQNLKTNGGDMLIGFDTATLDVTKYVVRLAPGDVYTNSDYTGAIYVQALINTEKVSFGEV